MLNSRFPNRSTRGVPPSRFGAHTRRTLVAAPTRAPPTRTPISRPVVRPPPTVPNPQPNVSYIDKSLAYYNLRRVRVPGDGNCQFRSMAVFFSGVDHLAMRNYVCDYIEKNQDLFEVDILNSDYTSVQQYLAQMRTPVTWGDAITLQAFSLLFDVDVVLFLPRGVTQLCPEKARHVAMIQQGDHYDAALPK